MNAPEPDPGLPVADNTQRKHTKVYIQDDCLKHRYIRSRDTSRVFERPERLRAVKIGLSAAIAHVEELEPESVSILNSMTNGVATLKDAGEPDSPLEADALAAALERMQIKPTQAASELKFPVSFTRTNATVDLLNHPAVKYVHGDIDGDVYLENLIAWARDSPDNIAKKGIEIPEEIPPYDAYRECIVINTV